MKRFLAACVLLLAQQGLAEREINVNSYIDRYLELFNDRVATMKPRFLTLPDFKDGPTFMSKGFIVGDDSNFRDGDAMVTVSDDGSKTRLEFHAGRRLFHIAFPEIAYRGEHYSGVYRVVGADFGVVVDVLGRGTEHCAARVQHLALDRVNKVIFSASVSKYNGLDLTPHFNRFMLPRINRLMAEIAPVMEHVLQKFACNPDLKLDDMALQQFVEYLVNHIYH